MSNPFDPQPEVENKDIEKDLSALKEKANSLRGGSSPSAFTTEELFDALINSMRSNVSKRLIKGAKGGYEKLLGDLDEGEFIQKHFTKIIEMRLDTAIKNNK